MSIITSTPREGLTALDLGAGKAIDVNLAFRAVTNTVLQRVGASDRMFDVDHIQFTVRCAPKRTRKVIVQLGGGDLYHLEIGYMNGRTLEWVSEHVQREIGVAELAGAVEAGYVAVYGG